MGQIEEFEQRITAALDRIGQGMGALGAVTDKPDDGELDTLKTALEDEKLANAQLEERIKALHEKYDETLAALKKSAEDQADATRVLDADLQRLRAANEQLRASNTALREANEAGVGEPHLINKAMLAELEALRAARATDVAETRAIVNALTPLLQADEEES